MCCLGVAWNGSPRRCVSCRVQTIATLLSEVPAGYGRAYRTLSLTGDRVLALAVRDVDGVSMEELLEGYFNKADDKSG